MSSPISLLYFFISCVSIQGINYKYLGCFKDEPAPNRALPHGYKNYFTNSVELCAEECAAYKYFGLAEGIECWCGDSGYDKYGPAPQCYYPCTGNSKETCGAIHVNSVYEIMLTTTTTTEETTTTTKRITTATKGNNTTITGTTSTAKGTTTATKRTTTTTKRTTTTAKGTTITTTQRHEASSSVSLSTPVPKDISTTPHDKPKKGAGVRVGGVVGVVIACITVLLVVAFLITKCRKKRKDTCCKEGIEFEPILRQRQNYNSTRESDLTFTY